MVDPLHSEGHDRLPCGCDSSVVEFLLARATARSQPTDGPYPSVERDPLISRSVARVLAPYAGEWHGVVHELRSWLVYLEVHLYGPTETHPYVDLFTAGMSQRRMNDPWARKNGLPDRAELLMQLPGTWAEGEHLLTATRRDDKAWPIVWLRRLARLPHERNGCLGHGDLVRHDGGPLPGCPFEGALIVDTAWTQVGIAPLILPSIEAVDFLDVVPVHESELAWARERGDEGGHRLAELLYEAGLDHTVHVDREPVV